MPTFPKSARLRLNREFGRVYRKGRFIPGRVAVLHIWKRSDGRCTRLGVTTSREVKGAVRRNRMRRLLRESFRLLSPDIPPGYDLVLVGRNVKESPTLAEVDREVRRLLRKAGLPGFSGDRKKAEPDHVQDPPFSDTIL